MDDRACDIIAGVGLSTLERHHIVSAEFDALRGVYVRTAVCRKIATTIITIKDNVLYRPLPTEVPWCMITTEVPWTIVLAVTIILCEVTRVDSE